jgi:hypothetical protein
MARKAHRFGRSSGYTRGVRLSFTLRSLAYSASLRQMLLSGAPDLPCNFFQRAYIAGPFPGVHSDDSGRARRNHFLHLRGIKIVGYRIDIAE